MVLEKAEVEKPLEKKRVKRASSRGKPIEKKEAEVQGKPSPSSASDYMLLPYGQLLRGVPVQVKGEYKLPLTTDVYSFATRKRTKE